MAARVQPVVKPARPYDLKSAPCVRFPNSYSHTKTSPAADAKKAIQDPPQFYRRSRPVVEEYCDPHAPRARLFPRWRDREME